jgi:hypothetical protein
VSPREVNNSVMASARSANDSIYTNMGDLDRPRDNIDSDFKSTLMALWKKTSTTYTGQLCRALQK